MDKNKKAFLEAFVRNGGNISKAAEAANVARSTVYAWKANDDEFKELLYHADESLIDHVEGKLMELINSNETAAVIFFLKTKGKRRGYTERQEIEVSRSFDLSGLSDEELDTLMKVTNKIGGKE